MSVCVLFGVCLLRQALCNSGHPRTHCANQGGFDLTEILLSLPPDHQAGLGAFKNLFPPPRAGSHCVFGLLCNLASNARDQPSSVSHYS